MGAWCSPRWQLTWVAAAVLLLITWVGVGVGGLALQALWPLPTVPAADAGWTTALVQVGKAAVVLLAFATIGVPAGALTRSSISGSLAAIGGILVSWLLAGVDALRSFTFARWVAEWIGFRRGSANFDVTHLWPDVFPQPNPTRGFVGIASIVAILAWMSVIAVRRREV